jgi:hypothetical protein
MCVGSPNYYLLLVDMILNILKVWYSRCLLVGFLWAKLIGITETKSLFLENSQRENTNWVEFLSMASSCGLVVNAEDLWLRALCFKSLLMKLFIMLYLFGSKSTSKMINVNFPTYLALMHVLLCANNGSIFKTIKSNQINTNCSLAGFIQFKICKNLIDSESKYKTWPIRRLLSCIWHLIW